MQQYKAIAIDGPAGAGKSTIAKKAAQELGFIYADTGALYRAIGYHVSQNGIDTKDEKKISEVLKNITIELKFIDNSQRVFVNNEDVSDKIRTPQMAMYASNVSAIQCVRDFLLDLQRDMAKKNNIIMDGRDIGTVILPDAKVKIFLTASPEKRAQRRYAEHINKGENVDYNKLLEEIKQRDYNDSNRAVVPLRQAEDAVLADTTELDLESSIKLVLDIIKAKI